MASCVTTTYTSEFLSTLNNYCKVSINVLQQLRLNNIVRPKYKKTKRGCRGGKNRRIRTVKLSNQREIIKDNKKANLKNLKKLTSKADDGGLLVACTNARSVCNKAAVYENYIIENDIDVFIITETWLVGELDRDSVVLHNLIPTGYTYQIESRKQRGGGGIICIYKNNLSVKKLAYGNFSSFEHLVFSIILGSKKYKMVVIYRPPQSKKNKCTTAQFVSEFHDFILDISVEPSELIVTGDFNIHMDNLADSYARSLMDVLSSVNLQQHVTEPTHQEGHILDLLITSSNSNVISSVYIEHDSPSDHSIILFTLKEAKPKPLKTKITFRRKKKVNIEELKDKIVNSDISAKVTHSQGVSNKMNIFEKTLLPILDNIAPLKTIKVTARPNTEWFNDSITEAKRDRRRAERRWRKSGLEVHKQIYQRLKLNTNKLIEDAKQKHVKEQLEKNKGDSKHTFKVVNKILKHNLTANKLPKAKDPKDVADTFCDFFTSKVENIRELLDSSNDDTNENMLYNDIKYDGSVLNSLSPTSEEEVKEIIKNSPTKECPLDAIPTWVIKTCLEELTPAITSIVNESLQHADLPPKMKTALVTPLLKKATLDPDNFNNYRPVSNLNFVSKIIEKVVASRIHAHLKVNSLAPYYQSAYRQMHSTETALLRVYNDIVNYVDQKHCVLLVLLDLSAAFDTIDQNILISRLRNHFGIEGNALQWITSYLTDRHQAVRISNTSLQSTSAALQETSDTTSHSTILKYGVPQGSVLGPILFTLYTAPLSDIISAHGIQHHLYADDTQLYTPISEGTEHQTLSKIQECCMSVKKWMKTNKLKLNDAKTEVILFGTDYNRKTIDIDSLVVGDSTISIEKSGSVRNLGVHFNSDLSMRTQVTKICQTAHYHLKNIGKIRNILDENNCKMIIHSLVTSRLDYCNSLLQGLPSYNLDKLQKIQNKAAKMITLSKGREHAQPILRSLHWLPVHQRIKFKILCIVFKCLHNIAPSYLSELLCRYTPRRPLRSQSEDLLITPDHRLQLADKAFSISGPKLWNTIPGILKQSETIEIFKKQLKSELFKEAYIA